MSLFFRQRRSTTEAQDLIPHRAVVPSFAEPVTYHTSTQVVAYAAAVNLRAGVISSLPLKVYRGEGEERVPAPTPPWLNDPGSMGYGIEDWLKQWVTSAAYTGNVVAEIAMRGPDGSAAVLTIHPAESVTYGREGWRIDGRAVSRDDILHYRRFPVPGKRFGRSPIEAHATTFSLALSAERFGSQWFQEGAHPSQVLETDQVVDADIADKVKARVLETMRGSRGPAVPDRRCR